MAFDIAQKAVEMQVRDAVGQATTTTTAANSASPINWNDYNFPPCLHLVHFSLGELQGTVKRFVLKVYLSYMIVVAVLWVNRNFRC